MASKTYYTDDPEVLLYPLSAKWHSFHVPAYHFWPQSTDELAFTSV